MKCKAYFIGAKPISSGQSLFLWGMMEVPSLGFGEDLEPPFPFTKTFPPYFLPASGGFIRRLFGGLARRLSGGFDPMFTEKEKIKREMHETKIILDGYVQN